MNKVKFKVTPSEKADAAEILLEGDLSIKSAAEIKTRFKEAFHQYSFFGLCVKNVSAIDLTGIQLLYSFTRSCKEERKVLEMELVLSEEVEALINKAGFNKIH